MTDYIVGILILFLLVNGFVKGFLRTILGPLALIISIAAASYYYSQTHNIITSFLIGILGPLFIKIFFSLALNIFDIAFANKEMNISLISRLTGAIVNYLWGSTYIISLLIFLTILPFKHPKIQSIQHNIKSSFAFGLIDKITENFEPLKAIKINDVLSGLNDPEVVKRVQNSIEFQNLNNNNAFKEFFNDNEIQKILTDKNAAGLIKSPQLQNFLTDKDALKMIMDLNKKIIEEKNLEIDSLLKNVDGEASQEQDSE